jgi:LysR family glycine cleavage system transcriptional activator
MNWSNLPPLNSLRAFTAVAETDSYSKAATLLHVTHAAVSQQVKLLESYLGIPLVVRDGRGISLTAEGAILARDLQAGFTAIRKGIDALTDAVTTHPVQVTMSPAFAVKWLMPRLADFQSRYPDITLLLNPTGHFVDLKPGGMDVAIRYCTHDRVTSDLDVIGSFDLVVVGTPSLVGNLNITDPAQLLELPWLQELGTNEVGNWFSQHGVLVDRPLAISHMPGNLILDAVCNGEGITYTARQWVRGEIRSGKLVELFAQEAHGYFYILTPHDVLRPPVKDFVGWLKEHAQAFDGS